MTQTSIYGDWGENEGVSEQTDEQLSMPRHAGLGREARLNLALPFQSLIMRLIYPVTRVTILPYDLLFSRPDEENEPKWEGV